MKKLTFLLLSIALVFSLLLTSCNGIGNSPDGDKDDGGNVGDTDNNGSNTGDSDKNDGNNAGDTDNNEGNNTGDTDNNDGNNTGDDGNTGDENNTDDSGNTGSVSGDFEVVEDAPTYNAYWDETLINYQLTEATDGGRFTSGTRRYYAGGDTASTKVIDISIRNRNGTAAKNAKVKINYQYLADTKNNDWSKNIETFFINSINYKAGKSVDIYCNFAYDLTGAAAKGCFANLFSNTDLSEKKYGAGKNFFRFTEADYEYECENYFDRGVGEGYFFRYMQSLTLSNDKMYVLGSDYCTDLVRAFHVVPVNIELMNNINPAVLAANLGDDYNEELTNIQNLYEMVWANKWNYDTLLKFSKSVYTPNQNGLSANADITDTLGFGIPAGTSLPACGLLYSSSVEILKKEHLTAEEKDRIIANSLNNPIDYKKANFIVGDYLVYYPDTNQRFTDFADALNDLFERGKTMGVCIVNSADGDCRASFIGGKMLFGSIIELGSLEDPDYQGMRAGTGFGIVPVPVFDPDDEYRTFVHNNARVIAIETRTDRFEQISAYLDCQSRTSSDILNMYYESELAQSLRGEIGDDNSKMLTYIRNHAGSVFDKTCEDLIGVFNVEVASRKWHEILRINRYQVFNMGMIYEGRIETMPTDLKAVINAWNSLQ